MTLYRETRKDTEMERLIFLIQENWEWLAIELGIHERNLRHENVGDADRLDFIARELLGQADPKLVEEYDRWRS